MTDDQNTSTPQQIGASMEGIAEEEAMIDPEVAEHWELWSRIIGGMALPRLEKLKERHPELTSAILCTADGMNLCSIGVAADDVGRLAALNSSLFAIASSQAEIVSDGAASRTSTSVNLSTGRGHVALASFVQAPLGQLLLALSADNLQLGVLVVRAREAAKDIQEWLTEAQRTDTP